MKFYYILIVLILGFYKLFPQDITTTEIKVVENFIPTILDAARLNENAIFLDTVKPKKTQSFKAFFNPYSFCISFGGPLHVFYLK